MRRLLFLTLSMSMLLTAQAGYVIRGISVNHPNAENLMNYTLTFDGSNNPIAAGTMHTSFAFGSGRNCIVIIDANSSGATAFRIPWYDIEVRDFHRIADDEYVLCGSRRIDDSEDCAFVAVITSGFTVMDFYEYPDATMFYSIWAETYPALDYYVCGTHKEEGVIASIDRTSMLLTNFYITDMPWEYHKIIAKRNTDGLLRFVASGRTPDCTQIGFTAIDPSFTTIDNYAWAQNTEPDSHCVVSDDVLNNNTVILASSYGRYVTLNPVTFPFISPMQTIVAYRFSRPNLTNNFLYVQDIGVIQLTANSFRISVAGNDRSGSSAWHGYVVGLSNTSIMTYNFYYRTPYHQYGHYKIRHNPNGEYTGGYYQDDVSTCALFGTPLTAAFCDDIITSSTPNIDLLNWTSFNLMPVDTKIPVHITPFDFPEEMDAYYDCTPFKKGESPELATSPETESEIIAFPDRISLKDVPFNTNYQIYSVIGQLIQTGATTPDISTAQIGRGVYILRLENGKTFKFVK